MLSSTLSDSTKNLNFGWNLLFPEKTCPNGGKWVIVTRHPRASPPLLSTLSHHGLVAASSWACHVVGLGLLVNMQRARSFWVRLREHGWWNLGFRKMWLSPVRKMWRPVPGFHPCSKQKARYLLTRVRSRSSGALMGIRGGHQIPFSAHVTHLKLQTNSRTPQQSSH